MNRNDDFINNDFNTDINGDSYEAPIPVWEMPNEYDAQTLNKKREVKWLANAIGLALCLQVFLIYAIDFIVVALFNNFASDEQFANFLMPTVQRLYGAAKSLIIMTVPFILTSKLSGIRLINLLNFKKSQKGRALPVIMIGVGVCSIANMATSIFAVLFESAFGTAVQGAPSTTGGGTVPFTVSLVCVGILPALVEEFAFRGVILGVLRKRASDGMAIFVSALLFSLVHGNLQQIPFAFIVGLVLAYAVIYTGSIIPAMIIHALNNVCTVVLTYASIGLSPQVSGLIFWLYLLTFILIGLCGLVVTLKTDENAFKLSQRNSADTKNNITWFFSSAFLVFFLVICILETFYYQFG